MPSHKKTKKDVDDEVVDESPGVDANLLTIEPLVKAGDARAIARLFTEKIRGAVQDTVHEIESEDEEDDHDDIVDEWRDNLWRVHLIPTADPKGVTSFVKDILDDETSVESCEDDLSDEDDRDLWKRVHDHAKRYTTKHLSIRTSRRIPIDLALIKSLEKANIWRVKNEQDSLRLTTIYLSPLMLKLVAYSARPPKGSTKGQMCAKCVEDCLKAKEPHLMDQIAALDALGLIRRSVMGNPQVLRVLCESI